MAERSEAKRAKLRSKIFLNLIFDAKLRFAILASLRSAIFSEKKEKYIGHFTSLNSAIFTRNINEQLIGQFSLTGYITLLKTINRTLLIPKKPLSRREIEQWAITRPDKAREKLNNMKYVVAIYDSSCCWPS